MAGNAEAKIAALLSLLAAILLLHTLRLRGAPGAALVVADLLRATPELVNRRNMILLCHAILLLVLRDAGLLAAPARRRATVAATAVSSAAAGASAYSLARPQSKSIVVWSNSRATAAATDAESAKSVPGGGGLEPEHGRPEPATATARVRRGLPLSTGASRLVEKHSSSDCFNFDHAAGKEIAAVEDTGSCFRFEQIADDEGSRGEEKMAREETEAECCIDEMNKRFEEFIANTRRKMQLESLQLVKV